MTIAQIILTLLFIWGIPSTYFRSKFRKIVYQTDDWKINIKPLFKKEIIGLFSNMYPENPDYIKTRNQYRIYLLIYLIIFILYQFFKTQSQNKQENMLAGASYSCSLPLYQAIFILYNEEHSH